MKRIQQTYGRMLYINTALLGTGKSHVIIFVVDQLMNQYPRHRILICAPTDAAVDELVRRLLHLRFSQDKDRFNGTTSSLLSTAHLKIFVLLRYVF